MRGVWKNAGRLEPTTRGKFMRSAEAFSKQGLGGAKLRSTLLASWLIHHAGCDCTATATINGDCYRNRHTKLRSNSIVLNKSKNRLKRLPLLTAIILRFYTHVSKDGCSATDILAYGTSAEYSKRSKWEFSHGFDPEKNYHDENSVGAFREAKLCTRSRHTRKECSYL